MSRTVSVAILFIECVFQYHHLSYQYAEIQTYFVKLGPHTLKIKYAYNDNDTNHDDDDDENDYDDLDNDSDNDD